MRNLTSLSLKSMILKYRPRYQLEKWASCFSLLRCFLFGPGGFLPNLALHSFIVNRKAIKHLLLDLMILMAFGAF